ncbi:hypothetical protein [Syntrophobacter fumaroxidans]|uniref:Uncharacterized protein n=1 Tax=Syntrophobacter fumaroxidans (strain DSM 10017 / MPOB) TaxID=335543 RepID=A0LFM6_SYNFM|nr:hypothetical protein [Syntrophobacter fumaroxidans]ABK16228.1 hypothetical protein Sfum_0529 [Syntrophobacter fumaroxidans MPOB]
MRTFRDHLQEKLQDKRFGELFDEEKELVRIGIEVAEARAKLGMSQADLQMHREIRPPAGSESFLYMPASIKKENGPKTVLEKATASDVPSEVLARFQKSPSKAS